MVVLYVPVIAGCLAYVRWTAGPYGLLVRTLGHDPVLGLALGLGASLPVILLSRWLTPRVPALERLARGLGRMTGPIPGHSAVLVAAVSALAEELLFRAVIQHQLGAVLGVVLFAAAHVPFERELRLWPVFALGAGVLFAGLYAYTGSVLAPTVAHFAINAVNLAWIGKRYGADPQG